MRKLTLSVLLVTSISAAAPGVVATGSDPDRDTTTGPLPIGAGRQIYVMTDKPLYRPGETIWFRVWEVDSSLAAAGGSPGFTVQLVDPRGGVAVEKRLQIVAGSAHNDIALPASLAGGRYTLRIKSDAGALEDRELTISTYEIPRLKQKLEFAGRGYSAGDEVFANLTVLRSTGEAARGARVIGNVVVAGRLVAQPTAIVGKDGAATLRFRLPEAIGDGDGLLTASVTDGGATESIQRRIPIQTGRVAVTFYPEGGDLVAGLPSRVYFSASSPLGEPVDVAGKIVDDTGAKVATFKSSFRGKGVVELSPVAGRRYQAVIDKPATTVALPIAQTQGCVLGVPAAASARSADIVATVACTSDQPIAIVGALRGREIGRVTGTAGRTPTTLRLPLAAAGQGAVRVTLLAATAPIAERLVYRKLGSDLSITVKPQSDAYAPREQVAVTLEARDASGKPVQTDLAIAVVDDAVLSLADDRSARILARLYLEPEMPGQKIDDPNFYFSADPNAPAALDLVLGTQGWRRFKRVPVAR